MSEQAMHGQAIQKSNMILTLISLMITLLLAALDSTIVGTAMPKIIGDLNGMEHYSWPFTAYMLCSTVAMLIFGKLSDTHGRKPVFIFGIIIFLVSSALCGLSQSMMQLVLFRGVQGIGGGVIVSSVFIIVGEMFPPKTRGKYMGILASMFGLSSVIGPAIGGFITDALSWRWVFYVNIPLGIVALVMAWGWLSLPRSDSGRPLIDRLGIAVFIGAVVPLFLALNSGGNTYPWLSPEIGGLFLLSLAMTGLLVRIERRAPEPIFPPSLFSSSVFNVSAIAMFFSRAAMFCGVIYVPLFVQTVLGKSATKSGGITTPMMLGVAVAATASGQIISRTGKYKVLGIVSLLFTLVGVTLLATMDGGTPGSRVLVYSALLGLGSGGVIPVFNIAVQSAFSRRQLGIVTSSMQFFGNMGATFGTAIFGSILRSSMANGFKALDPAGVPGRLVDALANPRTLTDEGVLSAMRARVPLQSLPALNNLIVKAKAILVHSIDMVFVTSVGVVIVALVASFFLKEMPLRREPKEGAPG
jgi:EmrB/QacA subfamily drug resistance transporter